uniref:Uncharacterized protein n=1 Tax=Aegilops tauschii subsp. strangulata TaxID=200361 RepID=A0A453JMI9_AEGTS
LLLLPATHSSPLRASADSTEDGKWKLAVCIRIIRRSYFAHQVSWLVCIRAETVRS